LRFQISGRAAEPHVKERKEKDIKNAKRQDSEIIIKKPVKKGHILNKILTLSTAPEPESVRCPKIAR
jgi:predicted aldo/keto reductase-like oxidoreductase